MLVTRSAKAQLVSAAELIDKRDIYKKLFLRDPELGFFDYFASIEGRSEAVSNEVYEHYEEGSIFASFTIASATGTGTNGAPLVLTLAAASHSADGTKSYPQVGGTIQLVQNGSQFYIKSKSVSVNGAHTLTCTRINSTQTVTAANLTNTKAWVIANAYSKGTGQPDGISGKPERWENQTQIIKGAFDITGSDETNETYIEVDGPNGPIACYYLKGEADEFDRFKARIANAILFQEKSDTDLVDAAGDSLRTTGGLIPGVEDYGLSQTYNKTGTTYDPLTFFSPIIKKLNAARACDEYMMRADLDFSLRTDSLVSIEMKAYGSLVYNGIGGKQKAEVAGYDSFKWGSWTFHKTQEKLFTHDQLAGTGTNYNEYALLIPLGFKKDAKSKKDMPQIRLRHKALGGNSRQFKVWQTGSNAPTPTNELDVRKVNYRAEVGLQYMGIKDFMIVKGV
jgi:hypothetical protein